MVSIFGLIFFLSTVLLVVSLAIEQAETKTSKVAVILTVAFGLSLIIYWYGEQKVGSVTQEIQDYLVYENLYCE
jgi:nucleoside permease NupC